MSDDCFGGGGQNDRDPQAMEYFRVKIPNEYSVPWAQNYKGIFRANSLLSSIGKVDLERWERRKATDFWRSKFSEGILLLRSGSFVRTGSFSNHSSTCK